MSNVFREFLQKVGSGNHTGENLTRAQAATATKMMLLGEATPAQIGAFLIAHRTMPYHFVEASYAECLQELGLVESVITNYLLGDSSKIDFCCNQS